MIWIDAVVRPPTRRHILSVILLALALAVAWLASRGLTTTHVLAPAAIAHEEGYGYTADVYKLVRKPLRIRQDTEASTTASDVVLTENGRPLGPAHSIHDDIRSLGSGRYSHWDRTLLFSASDNSDPRTNDRTYELKATAHLSDRAYWVVLCLLLFAAWIERSLLRAPVRRLIQTQSIRWFGRNIAPGLIVSFVIVGVIAIAGEFYFRLTTPFSTVAWPSEFNPRVGFLFKPGAEVRWTNNLDYWTAQKANSLGFLDREPPGNPDPKRCQVVLIGDSFVEAAQVPNSEKAQTVLERLAAKEHPEWRLSVSAFGYSGTGQLNQLPFYDEFARAQHPSLVVLVFVSNDFANNSTVLEAIRNGWNPDHTPRVFARRDPTGGGYSIVPIDPNWRKHLLPTPTPTPIDGQTCRICELHSELKAESMFYRWIATKLELLAPALIAPLEPSTLDQATKFRIDWLAKQPAYAKILRGWDGRLNMDAAFYEKDLLPVFQRAIGLTGFALDEFTRRVKRDHSRLVVLATSQMSTMVKTDDPGYGRRYVNRLKALTDERKIPLLDQFSWAVAKGIAPSALEWRHDSHWNPLAHRVAAEMLLEYLEANPGICSPTKNRSSSATG